MANDDPRDLSTNVIPMTAKQMREDDAAAVHREKTGPSENLVLLKVLLGAATPEQVAEIEDKTPHQIELQAVAHIMDLRKWNQNLAEAGAAAYENGKSQGLANLVKEAIKEKLGEQEGYIRSELGAALTDRRRVKKVNHSSKKKGRKGKRR